MSQKTILIGQSPSRSGRLEPLSSEPLATRLAHMAGLSKSQYLRVFERMNVLDKWSGKRGNAFPIAAARKAALDILPHFGGRRVVFLGMNVARAFYFQAEFLEWKIEGYYVAAILPHPSGLNIWYNTLENVAAAKRFLQSEAKRSCAA